MKLLTSFVAGLLVGLIAIAIILPTLEPSSRDECIYKNFHKVQSDRAANLLNVACENLYGAQPRPRDINAINSFLDSNEPSNRQTDDPTPPNPFEKYLNEQTDDLAPQNRFEKYGPRTVTNPTTGERIQFINGEWVPIP